MTINIIDVGLGNVRSLEHWLQRSNLFYNRVSKAEDLSTDLIVIPGVASAGEYMYQLKKSGLDKEIIKRSTQGQKIIGICLGFQILTEYSEENEGTECLGILKGSVKYIENNNTHNGWDEFQLDARELSENNYIKQKKRKKVSGRVYFNHELRVDLNNLMNTVILKNGITSYTIQNNIFGFQFHPEKSQKTGQDLLELIL